ncbi:uncharacterized protein F5891DRAFT_1216956 [Suillus fuscotomentosus]|uniref:CxC2-like cysteine cluster KDZ transposase-associated domain-containing protein n=1 Tax=Suillus fuscotomentosus TaxID=1912939 RepID=A0AAD4DPT7_9AGAM|nr:uncharacterized protein F5891DRAFT_1216956 [Suillus fuscotomentosus]KAG1888957.1 hypothetical protein F5891DRAFT_1216956 [Suillus fuscotomentosus]
MSRGRSAKSSRVERTRFIPSSAANSPLLRLRTGEITTEGRTQLHTHYVPAPSLHVFDSLDTGSDAESLCCCGLAAPRFRCRDCFGTQMFCHECVLHNHTRNPLHRIDMWNDSFFQLTSLKKLGLRVQLGHTPGERCYNPRTSSGDEFIVIDVHSVHEIALDFCGCASAQIRYKQLLRARWYPATISDPRTAATFALLEHFHLLSFESKVSAYEFYHSLARRNNNAGLSDIRDRYSAFMCMVHEWRHLRQLRRAGRGHDPGGINATTTGELAVQCPACPHPGKNLPQGWEDQPLSVRWKYALFIAIDANFRLKRKAVSSDNVDPSLNSGWAYFVEEVAYKSYLADQAGVKQDRSMCVSHNAVNMADTKSSDGLAATGVGAVDCARHDMKLANGVGDLQKGEKYINMDYLVFSALLAFTVTMVNISYNIACKWHKKLWTRMEGMPSRLHIPHDSMTFHLKAHIEECQRSFSFNWTKHVGRTDGEAPERGWSNINHVATSTKEMGPGSRCDTLDDHFGDWNWKKVTALGRTLLRKIGDAIKWKREHREALGELEKTIEPTLILQWMREVEAWENDNSQRNPFESRFAPITQAAVRLQLAELEARELQAGINVSLHTDISPSRLITSGIDLQDQQQRLKVDIANMSLHPTDNQKTNLQTRITTLQRRIDAWARIQELYIPVVSQFRHRSSDASVSNTAVLRPKTFKLWLPSELEPTATCDERLAAHEWELRHAQALDSLNEIRSHLRLWSHMYIYKDRNVRGQAASTRAQALIDGVEVRKQASVEKYRRARNALLALSHRLDKSGWEISLPRLLDSDVRPMGDMERQGTGTISWIWLDSRTDNTNSENDRVQDCVRVEWCKARARVNRWSEEVDLLLEEMRRVTEFLKWQAGWWGEWVNARVLESAEQEGVAAYAYRQAALRTSLVASFQHLWRDVPKSVIALSIPMDSEDVPPTIDARPRLHDDL